MTQNIPQFSGNIHNTDIGSLSTNIHFEENLLKFTVGGVQVMSFQTNPAAGSIITEYVQKSYLNTLAINNMANQSNDYNCQGYRFINAGEPIGLHDLVTKQYVDNLSQSSQQLVNSVNNNSYLQATQTNLVNGSTPLNMNSQKITNLQDPSFSQDGATKNYVDQNIAQLVVSSGGNQIMNSTNLNSKLVANQIEITNGQTSLNMNGQKITNIANPTSLNDAVNKQYVDAIQSNSTQIVASTNSESVLKAMNTQILNGLTPLNMNGQQIKLLQDPQASQDGATKNYVDNCQKQKIINIINANSVLTANQTELTNGQTPLNMNNQLINNVANPLALTDAVNVQYLNSQCIQLSVGQIISHLGTLVSSDYLLCNGATFNKLIYPSLYTFLGNSSVLPDLRGYVLRGLDTTGLVDPQGASRTLGSIQQDAFKSHNHKYTDPNNGGFTGLAWDQNGAATEWPNTNGGTTTNTGDVETRMKNVAVNYYILAVNKLQLSQATQVSTVSNTYQIGQIIQGVTQLDLLPNSKWLLCDGSIYNTTLYNDLYSLTNTNKLPLIPGITTSSLNAFNSSLSFVNGQTYQLANNLTWNQLIQQGKYLNISVNTNLNNNGNTFSVDIIQDGVSLEISKYNIRSVNIRPMNLSTGNFIFYQDQVTCTKLVINLIIETQYDYYIRSQL